MAVDPTTTGEHPATNVEVRTAVTWGSLRTVAAIVVTVFGGGWIGYATVVHAAEQTVDGGLTPVKLQVSDIDKRLERHIDEEARHHRAQEAKSDEMAADIRALYKAVLTGQKQERLERPADAGEQLP